MFTNEVDESDQGSKYEIDDKCDEAPVCNEYDVSVLMKVVGYKGTSYEPGNVI